MGNTSSRLLRSDEEGTRTEREPAVRPVWRHVLADTVLLRYTTGYDGSGAGGIHSLTDGRELPATGDGGNTVSSQYGD